MVKGTDRSIEKTGVGKRNFFVSPIVEHTMQPLYHNRVRTQEIPVYDAWSGAYQLPPDMARYYGEHLKPYGSFANMFFQDAVEPGNEYRRRTTSDLLPKPQRATLPNARGVRVGFADRKAGSTPLALAPGYNPLITDSVNVWGRRLQQNTNNSMSMFSTLDDAYHNHAWENYTVAKPFMDWNVYETHVAHADDVANLWFR